MTLEELILLHETPTPHVVPPHIPLANPVGLPAAGTAVDLTAINTAVVSGPPPGTPAPTPMIPSLRGTP